MLMQGSLGHIKSCKDPNEGIRTMNLTAALTGPEGEPMPKDNEIAATLLCFLAILNSGCGDHHANVGNGPSSGDGS